MSSLLRRTMDSKLSVAVVTAVVTALVAGGGVAVALTVPNNSVTSASIVNGQVKTLDIKDGGVKSEDIRDGTIVRADMAVGTAAQFARVHYTSGTPGITAQSGGIAVVSEPFAGAVTLSFPVNMDNCAVVATAFTGGATTSIRRSTIGSGTQIAVVGFDDTGATLETDFDVIAQC